MSVYPALLASLPEPVPVSALSGDDPAQGDWDTCPRCNFISVACDCDALTEGEEQ